MFPIGHQRIGIVTEVPVLDGDGHPVYDELMAPEMTDSVVWKDGCLFELETLYTSAGAAEQQSNTTTTSEIGWGFLPADADTMAIESTAVIRYCKTQTANHDPGEDQCDDCRDYVMRGDGVTEADIRGRNDHVAVLCERAQG